MKHIIIGTAGHIDHGKTALIKALTGRDTDRLKEEKQRGITTDLGFTWFDLSDGSRCGIVDVPGHEKLVSNMAAGAVGMDLVLMVVAADEGIMPQTREHMHILELLGVKNKTLRKHGAVSRQTAKQMAKGAAAAAKADAAVSVTGIAGPDGGTKEKPVGLVYIGCYVQGKVTVQECHFSGSRSEIRQATVESALILLRECILERLG